MKGKSWCGDRDQATPASKDRSPGTPVGTEGPRERENRDSGTERQGSERARKQRKNWKNFRVKAMFSLSVRLPHAEAPVQRGNHRGKPHILWSAIFSLLLVAVPSEGAHFHQFAAIFRLARSKKEGSIDSMEFFGVNRSSLERIGKLTGPAAASSGMFSFPATSQSTRIDSFCDEIRASRLVRNQIG